MATKKSKTPSIRAAKPSVKAKGGVIGASYTVPKGQDPTRVPLPVVAQLVAKAKQKGFELGVDSAKGQHSASRERRGMPAARPTGMQLPPAALPLRPESNPALARVLSQGRAQQGNALAQVAALLQGRPGNPPAPAALPRGVMNPLDAIKLAQARQQAQQAQAQPGSPLAALAMLRRLRGGGR